MISSDLTDMIGAKLANRYRLDSILGAGGMGAVFCANDGVLSRSVALKIPHVNPAFQDELTYLFVQEAKLLAQLSDSHFFPNLYDLVLPEDDTRPFMVMELLKGKSLWATIRHNRQLSPVSWYLEVASQIARALAVLHERGIVHQDIKPKNVFLTSQGGGLDFVKILDLGVSVTRSRLSMADASGRAAGTRIYMAPEVISDGKIGEEGDIYAFAVLLVELIASEYPYHQDRHEHVLGERATNPSSLAGNPNMAAFPASLRPLLERMLSRNPSSRPRAAQCVDEFHAIRMEFTGRG